MRLDPAKKATFSYADLWRLQTVSESAISPDGKWVAYILSSMSTKSDSATSSLWVVHVSDKKTVLVSSTNASTPAWAPDGHALAFVSEAQRSGASLLILRVDDFQVLHTFSLQSSPAHLAWSPDGQSIAFSSSVLDNDPISFLQHSVDEADKELKQPRGALWADPVLLTETARYRKDGGIWLKPSHSHLFVLSTSSGKLRQLGSDRFDDKDPSWMPDGRKLLFTSDRRAERARNTFLPAIYTADITTGNVVRLTETQRFYDSPVASNDGQWIAFVGSDLRPVNYTRSDLYVMRADGTNPHRIGLQLDRDLYAPRWTADGSSVYAEYDNNGIARVGLFGLDGEMRELASGLDGSFSVAKNGDLAYATSTVSNPSELISQPKVGTATSLTDLNSFLRRRKLASIRQLQARSSADGVAVEGWVLLPPGAAPHAKLPLILCMHGGPFGNDGPNWSSLFQLYASEGYAVVYANYRGSTSYGTSFSEPANHEFPGIAYDDLMSVVDEAIRLGFTDPDRLFLTGGSAGGELTAWIAGKTKRFKAAVAIKPVIDNLSEALTTDQYLGAIQFADAPPWRDEKKLWAQSPLSLAESIHTPMLFITGEQDFRTPLDQTLQLYSALQLQGVPTALLRVPGAGHETLTSRPSQFAAEVAATLAWFHHYDSSLMR